jgi:hypothetical protein
MTKPYLNLPASQTAVMLAAAQIYSAYIISGQVKEGEEKQWMKRSLKEAMSFAKTIDQYEEGSEDRGEESPPADRQTRPPADDDIEAELTVDETPARPPAAAAEDVDVMVDEADEADSSGAIPVEPSSSGKADSGEQQDIQDLIDELCETAGETPESQQPGKKPPEKLED